MKIIILLILSFLSINNVYAKEKVTFHSCVDGDTFHVTINGEKKTIRMIAIDTPETVHPTKGEEYYGKEASEYTCNKIKIGITKNIQQRYQSLCGSNSQGNEIIKVYVSESTYLNNLEKMIHEHFGQFRLKKTEWFASNKFGTLKYEEVIKYIEQLFSSADYKRCNEVRKKINELNKSMSPY